MIGVLPVEHSSTIAVALLAIGALWLRRGFVRNSPHSKAVGIAALAAAAATFALGYWIETPATQVNRVLDELIQAGLRRDAEAIAARISDRFQSEQLNKEALVERLRRDFVSYAPQSIRINGREFRSDGDNVVVDFVVLTSGVYNQTPVANYAIRAKAVFERKGRDWAIVKLQRFDVLGGARRELPLFAR